MQREKDRIYSDTYKGFNLIARSSEDQAYNKRNLDRTITVIESAFSQYSNLLQLHFTLRFPDSVGSTDDDMKGSIARFHKHLTKMWCKRLPDSKRNRGKLRYIEAIEIEKAKSVHIHFMVWCCEDRNRASGVVELINRAWEKAVGSAFVRGLVDYSYDATKTLRRSAESMSESMQWASYLCKSRGKQAGTVCFSSSRG